MQRRVVIFVAGFVFILVSASSAWMFLQSSRLKDSETNTAVGGDQQLAQQPDEAGPPTVVETTAVEKQTVTLTDAKRRALPLEVSTVSRQTVQPFHTVPGRVRYDDRRHIEVRLATSGILTRVHVKPGDRVAAGDVLAEISSPEVGHARADVLQRQSELRLVSERREWAVSTCSGLQRLQAAIQNRMTPDEIRTQFRTVSLGSSREKVLTAYSQLTLAETLATAAVENVASGVIPRRTLQERQSEVETAEASLLGTLEQLVFEANQACRQAEIAVEDAERRLLISRQTVRTLLGTTDERDEVKQSDRSESEEAVPATTSDEGEVLSRVELRAPFSGTIERQNYSASERVEVGESVFVLADTSVLWVAADLRDRDRGGLKLSPGDQLEVIISNQSEQVLKAAVYFVGREVDPSTNAIPVVAELPNTDGLLRPGMFVNVRVPMGQAAHGIAIPESAVVKHESRQFVFVPENDLTFRRVEVQTGLHSGELVEIVSGLDENQKVVVAGTFQLKSELLLESEE
ncbi:MAG: efflux RND transporter periplasmic adaptor subunit [Planctomyces sp.]|nr:efflux RND transporter periplasmic adaptor subunit [Planctomyces sp.]